MRRYRLLILAAAVAAVAPAAAARVLVTGEAYVTSEASRARAPIGTLRLGSDIASVRDPSRYDYVVLNAWEDDWIPSLKRQNPEMKVLVYKDMSSTRSYAVTGGVDDALLPTGVGWAAANASNPEWFLTDQNGGRIEWVDYPGHWQMDIGDRGYQEAWVRSVSSEVTAGGWDGVFVDNALGSLRWYLREGQLPSKYPTDEALQSATKSFLAHAGPPLVGAGLLVMPNISDVSVDVWSDWIGFTSGGVQEWYSKYGDAEGTGYHTDAEWAHRLNYQLATQRAGKTYIGITYGPISDIRAQRYSRGSFLLHWDGGPSALIYHPGKGVDGWAPDWTVNLGPPLGPRYQVGQAWRRDFAGGTVVLNPSSMADAAVDLGGRYVLPNGEEARSVILEPASALMLRRVLHAPSPTSSTPPGTTAPTMKMPTAKMTAVDPRPSAVPFADTTGHARS